MRSTDVDVVLYCWLYFFAGLQLTISLLIWIKHWHVLQIAKQLNSNNGEKKLLQKPVLLNVLIQKEYYYYV